ncbi:MAG TPA: hypothetical protein DEF59_03160 [Candidatus Magasanikbacteria bacterium]|nr:hypothetical protein [Candidatus Magasanikbacteria bacterium]
MSLLITLGAVVLLAGAGCARNEQTSNTSALGQTGVADEKQENTAPAGEKKEESSDSSVKAPSLTIDVPGVTVVTEPVKKSEDEDKKPATAQGATITYDDNGFSPSTLTVKVGTKVTFKNNSPSDFWPASAMHPTHEKYPGSSITKCGTSAAETIFDACAGVAQGVIWTFTFKEKGSWGYHNHLNASRYGKVVVE